MNSLSIAMHLFSYLGVRNFLQMGVEFLSVVGFAPTPFDAFSLP